MNDPWTQLDALIAVNLEPKGDDWFTLRQFRERYNLKDAKARNEVEKLLMMGRLEEWRGAHSKKYRLIAS